GQIGPAADVYALGAILYQLLTGWPPFHGASAVATLRQVLDEEPLPPARLRAQVSPDLEGICLRCLRKDPGQRYASAAALAQDLRRFLAGKPPDQLAGRRQRLSQWCRQHPVVLGSVLLLLAGSLARPAWLLLPSAPPVPQAHARNNPRPPPDQGPARAPHHP